MKCATLWESKIFFYTEGSYNSMTDVYFVTLIAAQIYDLWSFFQYTKSTLKLNLGVRMLNTECTTRN